MADPYIETAGVGPYVVWTCSLPDDPPLCTGGTTFPQLIGPPFSPMFDPASVDFVPYAVGGVRIDAPVPMTCQPSAKVSGGDIGTVGTRFEIFDKDGNKIETYEDVHAVDPGTLWLAHFIWTLPNPDTGNYLVRVTLWNADFTTGYDRKYFTITTVDGAPVWVDPEASEPFPPLPPVKTGDVAGLVTDAATANRLGDVDVGVNGYNALTDVNGNYQVSNIPVGSYTVQFAKVGYDPFSQLVGVRENAVEFVNAALTPIVPPVPGDLTTQLTCEAAGFYWYNEICNADPEPEKHWWEYVIYFDDDGVLHLGPVIVLVEKIQQWLEDNVYGDKASTLAKTVFYTALGAVGIGILLKIFPGFTTQQTGKLGTEMQKDAPALLTDLELKWLSYHAVSDKIAASPTMLKLMEIFGANTKLGLMGKFLTGIFGVDLIVAWLSSDNIITGTAFLLNKIVDAVEAGTITKEEALLEMQQVQEWKDYATNFVDISTILNPFLWLFRKSFMINTELAQANIDLIVQKIEATVPVPGTVTLTISSNPTGAKIYIDLEYTFETTNTTILVPAGAHTLTLKLSGYKEFPITYDYAAGETHSLHADLIEGDEEEPMPDQPAVTLEIPLVPAANGWNSWAATIIATDSVTGATLNAWVLIDDVFKGVTTPATFYLAPETTFNIKLRLTGYRQGELTYTTQPIPTS